MPFPNRAAARAAIASLRLARPQLPFADPWAALNPWECLSWTALIACADSLPAGGVLDVSAARPWDDPLWIGLLEIRPQLLERIVAVVPERLVGRWTAEPGDGPLSGVVRVAVAATGPVDDDEPLLRQAVLEARADDHPELVVRLLRLGQHELIFGRLQRAADVLSEATEIARRRAAGGDPARLRDLAAVLDELGDARSGLDDSAGALAAWTAGHETSQRLRPERPEARWGMAVSAIRLSRAAGAAGDYHGAVIEARSAVDAATTPERRAQTNLTLGAHELARGDLDAAEAALRTAVQLLEPLIEEAPRRFDLVSERLGGLRSLARSALARDDLTAANRWLEAATSDARLLVEREPARDDWRASVAAVATLRADADIAAGRLDRARASLLQAEAIHSARLGRDPDRAAALVERSRSQRRLTYVLACANEPEAADSAACADEAATQALLRARPDAPARHHDQALSRAARAWLTERDGERDEALAQWQTAGEAAAAAIAAASGPPPPALQRTATRCADAVGRLETLRGCRS